MKNNKEDIITKLIFGKKHKNNSEDTYCFVNPEILKEESIFFNSKNPNFKSPSSSKKFLDFNERSLSGKKSILFKNLSGIKEYNDKKRKIALTLSEK